MLIILNNIWLKLRGRKTLLGAIIHFAVIVIAEAQVIFGFQVLNGEQLGQIDAVATWIMGVGLSDKLIRKI